MIDENTMKEIGEEMNEQDKRSTAHVIFVIQSKRRRVATEFEDADIFEYTDADNETIDEENICEGCKDYFGDCKKETPCYENKIGYVEEWVFDFDSGGAFFFTAKACDIHIENNRHHYGKEARSYGISAYRNLELQKVMHYLSALGDPNENGEPDVDYRIN